MAECGALFLKSVTTYILLRFNFGIVAFALSHLVFSISLNFIYYILLPQALTIKQQNVSPENILLVQEFSWSCILKFVLSEGEKFLMISLALFESNADYSLVQGLVGMVCRLLLNPIEEAAYI